MLLGSFVLLTTACGTDGDITDSSDDVDGEPVATTSGGEEDVGTGQMSGATSDAPGSTGGDEASDGGDGEGTGTGGSGTAGDEGPPPGDGSGRCLGGAFEGVRARVFLATGSAGGAACNAAQTGCGGDPVGTWEVDSWCGDPAVNPFQADCPSSTYSIEVVDVSGTRTFDADYTFSQDITTVTNATLELDSMGCFDASCSAFEDMLQADFPSIDCSGSGASCTCELSQTRTQNVSGTWELVGDILGLTSEDGGVETFSICVDGDAMETWQEIYSAVPTDTPCESIMDCVDALGDEYESYVCVEDPM